MPKKGDIKAVLIDDDPDILVFADREFAAHGITNRAFFSSAKDYLDQITDEVQVVAVDHNLKAGMNGYELIKAIKDKNWQNFVIGYSGVSDPNILRKYINSDTDVFVNKNDENHMENLAEAICEAIPIVRRRAQSYQYFKDQADI